MGIKEKDKAKPGVKVESSFHPFRVMLPVFFLMLLLPISMNAQLDVDEYRVKSLFLASIAKHVEWPKSAEIDNPTKPFLICIFGENSFGTVLEESFRRDINDLKPRTIKGKNVEIKKIKHTEDIPPQCHMLYISPMNKRSLTKIIEFTQDKPILTLGDKEDYAREGVLVQFQVIEKVEMSEDPITRGGQILRVAINETAFRRAGLIVSEDLLKSGNIKIVNAFIPYKEKANLLEPIINFITWPPNARMNTPLKYFKIAVLGQNVFDNLLEETYQKKKLKDRPVKTLYISSVKDIDDVDLLFISSSMKNSISEIIAFTKNKPILTIGDTKGFAAAGVYINFFYEGTQLRFEINEKAGRASGFDFSYHLLKRATLIATQKP